MKKIICISFFMILYLTSQTQVCKDSMVIDSSEWWDICAFYEPGYRFWKYELPVCGCDSVTYKSQECAELHGVNEVTLNGGCQCIDSSVILRNRMFGELYYFNGQYSPVCGCDGKTYINAKIAYYYHGITKWEPEPCDCIELSFLDYDIPPRYLDSTIYPRDPYYCGCDSINYQNVDFATFKKGITSFTQYKCTCFKTDNLKPDTICSNVYDPVCGCDTLTYRNECVARYKYGLENYKPGVCKCVIEENIIPGYPCGESDLLELDPVCGCDSITYYNSCVAKHKNGLYKFTPGICRCEDTTLIDLNINCKGFYDPVCGCNDSTYFNICVAQKKQGIAAEKAGPCRCLEPKFIDLEEDCNELTNVDPVCGCDSITYVNSCAALHKGGVTSWSNGPCDFLCIDSFFIDTTAFCSSVVDPICGCDKVTYQNECVARNHFGVKSWKSGKCTTSSTIVGLKNTLILHPNPVKDRLFVKSNIKIMRIVVRGVDGEIVIANSSPDDIQVIDLGQLNSGLYVISLQDALGRYVTQKVVVF